MDKKTRLGSDPLEWIRGGIEMKRMFLALSNSMLKEGLIMKRSYVIFVLISLLLLGCATRGTVPSASLTNVDLSRKNYRIVKTNAMGESSGFRLLGIIPFGTPKPTEAMSDLYSKAGISEGKAIALVNVVHERSLIYLILFSIPKLTIRADIIEFLDEGEKK